MATSVAGIDKQLKKQQKKEVKDNKHYDRQQRFAKTIMTTSKQLVWLFSINGVLWIWCSYVLAFLDKTQIAEALSSNVCTVVLGQIGMYLITKTIENCAKYNELFGKSNSDQLKKEENYGNYRNCTNGCPEGQCTCSNGTTDGTVSYD